MRPISVLRGFILHTALASSQPSHYTLPSSIEHYDVWCLFSRVVALRAFCFFAFAILFRCLLRCLLFHVGRLSSLFLSGGVKFETIELGSRFCSETKSEQFTINKEYKCSWLWANGLTNCFELVIVWCELSKAPFFLLVYGCYICLLLIVFYSRQWSE